MIVRRTASVIVGVATALAAATYLTARAIDDAVRRISR